MSALATSFQARGCYGIQSADEATRILLVPGIHQTSYSYTPSRAMSQMNSMVVLSRTSHGMEKSCFENDMVCGIAGIRMNDISRLTGFVFKKNRLKTSQNTCCLLHLSKTPKKKLCTFQASSTSTETSSECPRQSCGRWILTSAVAVGSGGPLGTASSVVFHQCLYIV